MRRIASFLLASMAVALLLACGGVLASPSETARPDPRWSTGASSAIEQVGTNIWLGGRFSRVEQRDGDPVVANVSQPGRASTRRQNKYKDIAPKLGGMGC